MQANRTVAHAIALAVFTLLHTYATSAAEDPPAATPESIEEIEIVGQRTLSTLRLEIRREEEQMFDLFNDLNDVREFDVSCGEVIVTGSLIPARECVPRYIQRARFLNAQDFLQFGIPQKTEQELWWENRRKNEAFNAKIRSLAVEHPSLANTMLNLNAKKQHLQALEREQKDGKVGRFLSRVFGDDQDE
ncbi:MAG TPA: hypothetical protein VNR18_00210 [Hyphomicrobiales bacterium]|nr:hypothetical protein [Hyphomicrobiales bacterium]